MLDRSEILARLRERLVGYAASLIGRDAAEDLAQETLLLLETKYPSVSAAEELLPLAFRILRFKITAWRRKVYRHGDGIPAEDAQLRDGAMNPLEHAERTQLLQRLRAALPSLGERCRTLLRLRLEGLGFEQIRGHFGVESINTIYTWDLRCRRELMARLGWDAKQRVVQ